MNISITSYPDPHAKVLIYGIFDHAHKDLEEYNKDLAQDVAKAKREKTFAGGFGEIYVTQAVSLPFYRIVILGMGKSGELTIERLRRLVGKAIRATRSLKQDSCTLALLDNIKKIDGSALAQMPLERLAQAAAESIYLANYSFVKYLAEEKRKKQIPIDRVSLVCTIDQKKALHAIQVGEVVGQATNMVRDLVVDHAGTITPEYLEKFAHSLATKEKKLRVKVLNKAEMQRLGMNALLGVSAGSPRPPKLIFVEYKGTATGAPIAFVGKGITFDSGGYNLKPTKSIEEMKTDMAGGAAVLGTLWVAARLRLPVNLVGVIPACENMIGGTAQHPGDIVRAYNGKTIEIGNTDAEGRLILADALAYTQEKYNPSVIIDLATLTGACVVALGYYTAGLFSSDQSLISQLKQAGEESGDRVWPMPFFEEYMDWMDGTISDLNNISLRGKGGEAGSIMGAVFLKNFVTKTRWAHIDIAGTANWAVEGDYLGRGPTGSGVRLLTYYLLNQITQNREEKK